MKKKVLNKDFAPSRFEALIDYQISKFVDGIAPSQDDKDYLSYVYENSLWLRTEIVKLMRGESHVNIR